MSKIYVGSSWRNEYQPAIVDLLRLYHEVYDFRNPPNGDKGFAWSEIDANWQSWTVNEWRKSLQHEKAVRGFNSDFNGMKWADTCVLVMPCGRSAHIEAGWMAGRGKKTFAFVIDKCEPDLMYGCFDGIFTSMDELRNYFSKIN